MTCVFDRKTKTIEQFATPPENLESMIHRSISAIAAMMLAILGARLPAISAQSNSGASEKPADSLSWLAGDWEHAVSGQETVLCCHLPPNRIVPCDSRAWQPLHSKYSFTKKWAWSFSALGEGRVIVSFDLRDALCTQPWRREYKVSIRPALEPGTASLEIDPDEQGRAKAKTPWSGTYRATLKMDGKQLRFLWDDGTVYLADRK